MRSSWGFCIGSILVECHIRQGHWSTGHFMAGGQARAGSLTGPLVVSLRSSQVLTVFAISLTTSLQTFLLCVAESRLTLVTNRRNSLHNPGKDWISDWLIGSFSSLMADVVVLVICSPPERIMCRENSFSLPGTKISVLKCYTNVPQQW